jgi:hypothetical protein
LRHWICKKTFNQIKYKSKKKFYLNITIPFL